MNKRLLSIIIIAVGMIAGAVLVSNQQDINKNASTVSEEANFYVTPILDQENMIERLEISFSTGINENQLPIVVSAFSLRLKYPGDVTDAVMGGEVGPFVPNESLDEDWVFSVNKVYFEEGATYFDLSGIYSSTSGYSSDDQKIAEIEFEQGQFTNDDYSMLGWEDEYTKIMTKMSPVENIHGEVIKR